MFKKSNIWIGLKYDPSLQQYEWSNGESVLYTNWYNNHPDPRYGNHVTVSVHNGPNKYLYWDVSHENETHPFFCGKLKGSCVFCCF